MRRRHPLTGSVPPNNFKRVLPLRRDGENERLGDWFRRAKFPAVHPVAVMGQARPPDGDRLIPVGAWGRPARRPEEAARPRGQCRHRTTPSRRQRRGMASIFPSPGRKGVCANRPCVTSPVVSGRNRAAQRSKRLFAQVFLPSSGNSMNSATLMAHSENWLL